MYTGIIRHIGTVTALHRQENLVSYAVAFPHEALELGASVSVDGVCQTVVKIDDEGIWFDAIGETLEKTTLDTLSVGDFVNIERSARIGDEIGGHLMAGHVYGTGTLAKIEGNTYTIECPEAWMRYIFSKGFIAVNGASLTVGEVGKNYFCLHLIPETLERTTLDQKKVGDPLNLEFDALTQATVETVERIMSAYEPT